MARRNYYRMVVTNEYLGLSKEITAPSRYELDIKVNNQMRIWDEKAQRAIDKENKEQMKAEAERLTKVDLKKVGEYENLIKNINVQSSKNYYDSLIDKKEYEAFITTYSLPTIEEVNKDLSVPRKSFFEIFSKKKKEYRLQKENDASIELESRKNKYEDNVNKEKEEYEELKLKYLQEQKVRNEENEKNRLRYFQHKGIEVEKYNTYVLENSKYPENFVNDFELQYRDNERKLVVSYYLPNSESVPRVIQHKFVPSRSEIDIINMTDKKFEKFYNDIVYMCCLKTMKEIFDSDDGDNIDSIVYNGWIKYIDKSNGKEAESCIITVETTKEIFNNINLSAVDYKACIKGLKGIFAPSILSLTPVVPYMNIDREDSRFIESKEVSDIKLDGFNLATMPWEDFEYFVRELFDKMFNVNGGEVKVTQASHDGGVDAIAFDDDPIRGGKFVIQAKRYNNVVPVSAVRDLYGTMIHEGATKGILVTTSSYGKEAYDFAKDKPIKLINGQELLGLLNKYGYTNLTIKITR